MGININQFFIDNNFKSKDKINYGVYRNRVLAVSSENRQYTATISFIGQINSDLAVKVNEKMKEIKSRYRILLTAITTNIFLELRFYYSNNLDVEMLDVIDEAYNVLEDLGFQTCEICPICGKPIPTNAPFIQIKRQVIQVHNECSDILLGQVSAVDKSITSTDAKTLSLTIGIAILSMLTTIGIMALLSYSGTFSFFSMAAGWICLLICNIASIAFKLKNNLTRVIIISVASLISLLVSTYVGSVIDIYNMVATNGLTIVDVFKDYFKIVSANFGTYGRTLLLNLGFGILLLGMSVFSSYRQIAKVKNVLRKL